MKPRPWALAFGLAFTLAAGSVHAADPALLAAARGATERREWATALPLYERLLAAEPTQDDLLIEAARVHGFADRNASAAALYRRVLQVAPQRRADVLPSLAWQTLWSGDAATAATLFAELVAEPAATAAQRAEALDGLGQARLAQDDPAAAEPALREALALRPDDAGLGRRHARALLWSDRPDDAAAALGAHLLRHPDDRDARWMRGVARAFADRHAAALAEYAAAGPPRGDGERLDLARSWAAAGFEDRAEPLLAGQTLADGVWLRDYRVHREGQRYAWAALDHAVDRDSLETLAATAGAGWHPQPGQTVELRTRHTQLQDPAGRPAADELQGLVRWRLGGPLDPQGTLWPTLALRAVHLPDWTPLTGFARLTWLPADHWRVDAEASRDYVDTPAAIAQHATVQALSVGADHRLGPRTSASAAVAWLGFDDGNRRLRLNGRLEYLLAGRPRWTVGLEAMGFDDSEPSGPDRPGRGYWNPAQYRETRVFTQWRWEARPWDAYGRLALGTSTETDGWGTRSHGHPHQWELGVGRDFGPGWRGTAYVGGSGGSAGGLLGGQGYWRRTAGMSVTAWF